jgi:UDP-N-acetylmuramoyl-tripeptide--D-alanyl-D-alanine ligase
MSRRGYPYLLKLTRLYRFFILRKTHIIVVIGSLGKTTTMRSVSAALGLPEPSTFKQLGNAFAPVALHVLLTPPWRRYLVLEVGIGAKGQMIRYARAIRPDMIVFTSIQSEHIVTFKSIETIRDEKMEMVNNMRRTGVLVFNADDPLVSEVVNRVHARKLGYGRSDRADVSASNVVDEGISGCRFTLNTRDGDYEVKSPLLGAHQVHCVLAACAVASDFAVNMKAVVARISHLAPTSHRLDPIALPSGAMLVSDEFKSTLESIDSAFDFIEQQDYSKKVLILGSITDLVSKVKIEYKRIGKRIAEIFDLAIIVGMHHRDYKAGFKLGDRPAECLLHAGTEISNAFSLLPRDLGTGHCILIKGRASQKLERISLMLQGKAVACSATNCTSELQRCGNCRMLEKGWKGKRLPPKVQDPSGIALE